MLDLHLTPREAGLLVGAVGLVISDGAVDRRFRDELEAVSQRIAVVMREAYQDGPCTADDLAAHVKGMEDMVAPFGFGFTITARVPAEDERP